jgi:hypothetical protein
MDFYLYLLDKTQASEISRNPDNFYSIKDERERAALSGRRRLLFRWSFVPVEAAVELVVGELVEPSKRPA